MPKETIIRIHPDSQERYLKVLDKYTVEELLWVIAYKYQREIMKQIDDDFADVVSRWVSVNDRTPKLIEGKDYSEIVHGWNDKHGYMYVRLCWINDGDNSGYSWDIHSSQYGIDTDPEETMYEEDFPTYWQELKKPNV